MGHTQDEIRKIKMHALERAEHCKKNGQHEQARRWSKLFLSLTLTN